MLSILALVPACSSGTAPEATLQQFLEHVQKGDDAAARKLMVAAERYSSEVVFDKEGLADGFTLREAALLGDRVEIPVDMERQTPIQPRFVLLLEEGHWRVSINETVRLTVGMSPEEFQKQLAEVMKPAAKRPDPGATADPMQKVQKSSPPDAAKSVPADPVPPKR